MAVSTQGFSVRIFVPSGDPEALKIVEKSNWTGRRFPPLAICRSATTPGTKAYGCLCAVGADRVEPAAACIRR